jgi:hypothetical protein
MRDFVSRRLETDNDQKAIKSNKKQSLLKYLWCMIMGIVNF